MLQQFLERTRFRLSNGIAWLYGIDVKREIAKGPLHLPGHVTKDTSHASPIVGVNRKVDGVAHTIFVQFKWNVDTWYFVVGAIIVIFENAIVVIFSIVIFENTIVVIYAIIIIFENAIVTYFILVFAITAFTVTAAAALAVAICPAFLVSTIAIQFVDSSWTVTVTKVAFKVQSIPVLRFRALVGWHAVAGNAMVVPLVKTFQPCDSVVPGASNHPPLVHVERVGAIWQGLGLGLVGHGGHVLIGLVVPLSAEAVSVVLVGCARAHGSTLCIHETRLCPRCPSALSIVVAPAFVQTPAPLGPRVTTLPKQDVGRVWNVGVGDQTASLRGPPDVREPLARVRLSR